MSVLCYSALKASRKALTLLVILDSREMVTGKLIINLPPEVAVVQEHPCIFHYQKKKKADFFHLIS